MAKEWVVIKPTVKRYYVEGKVPLLLVMELVKKEHNFEAR